MYKIEVAYINNRKRNKINLRYKLDRIEYPYFDKSSAKPEELATVKSYDLLNLFVEFLKVQESQDHILEPNGHVAYKYVTHSINSQTRCLLIRIDKGEYGTIREAKDLSPIKNDLQLQKVHAVYEPFYLTIYLPHNYCEGLLFSINRGLSNVRTHFIKEFSIFFNSKFSNNLKFKCDLFTSPEVYKEWLNSDLISLTATATIDAVQDPTNKLNEFHSLTQNTQYKKDVTIKPVTKLELKDFFQPITNKNQGITLTDTYIEEFEEYDEVKVKMSKDGIKKNFVLKTNNPMLENSFSIPLIDLQYNVTDSHPSESSIAAESDKIYTSHKHLIS